MGKSLKQKKYVGGERGDKKSPSSNLGGLGPRRLQRNSKETCLLTPRGGFFDGRNQNRDPEPSAKTFQDSDKREPPNSRGMDVLKHTFERGESQKPSLAVRRNPWGSRLNKRKYVGGERGPKKLVY